MMSLEHLCGRKPQSLCLSLLEQTRAWTSCLRCPMGESTFRSKGVWQLGGWNLGVLSPFRKRKAARGKEEVSQGTLGHSKWELESEERESQWTSRKLLVWYSLMHPH